MPNKKVVACQKQYLGHSNQVFSWRSSVFKCGSWQKSEWNIAACVRLPLKQSHEPSSTCSQREILAVSLCHSCFSDQPPRQVKSSSLCSSMICFDVLIVFSLSVPPTQTFPQAPEALTVPRNMSICLTGTLCPLPSFVCLPLLRYYLMFQRLPF